MGLHTISDYVNEHRNKMKEKTVRYEEKKKQLKHAKERLNKAKARFRKRLNKSKQNNKHRKRTNSDNNKRNVRYRTVSDGDNTKPRLSASNLIKFNYNSQSVSSSNSNSALIGYEHHKNGTSSSVTSAFSAISDQSFIDDFHSITAELETIDEIINDEVKSTSMNSIFSDLETPKLSPSEDESKKQHDIKNNISL